MGFYRVFMTKRYFVTLNFLFFFSFLGQVAEVFAYFPSTLWSSERIPNTLIGLTLGHFLKPNRYDLVVIHPDGLILYEKHEETLIKSFEYNNKSKIQWMKVAAFDVDNDGLDELLLTGFHLGRVTSVVVSLSERKYVEKGNLSAYLNVVLWNGEKTLLSQNRLGSGDFSGPFYPMSWQTPKGQAPTGRAGKLVSKDPIRLPGQWAGDEPSLYDVSGFSKDEKTDGFLALSPTGILVHYQMQEGKWKALWKSGQEYGGRVTYFNLPVKDMMNQVTNHRFYVPLHFEVVGKGRLPLLENGPSEESVLMGPHLPSESLPRVRQELSVYLPRNEGYLKNVVGAVPSVRSSSIARLVWTGYGFQENWSSARFDGAITDFTLVDWDYDGSEEIVATFLLRDKGYVDTLKKQDSLIIVIKPTF